MSVMTNFRAEDMPGAKKSAGKPAGKRFAPAFPAKKVQPVVQETVEVSEEATPVED